MAAKNEEIRTIYVSGFPMDVKERELNLLFRTHAGFESASIKHMDTPKGPRVNAWVNFDSQAAASLAIADVEGYVFDSADPTSRLRASLARSNTKGAKRTGDSLGPSGYDDGRAFKRQTLDPHAAYQFAPYPYAAFPDASAPPRRAPNPSSNTLYITSSDPAINETVVQDSLAVFPGFVRMKTGKNGRSFFAEFSDVESAANSLVALQGLRLGIGQYPLGVEYAKSSMKD